MTVVNAFQSVRPKSTEAATQITRRPGYLMGTNGKFVSPIVPNKKTNFIFPPPLTKEEKIERDMRSSSIRSMEASPLRKKNPIRKHKSGAFVGI